LLEVCPDLFPADPILSPCDCGASSDILSIFNHFGVFYSQKLRNCAGNDETGSSRFPSF
jgi:hypothetical protein